MSDDDLDTCDRCGASAERIFVGHETTTGFDGLCGGCLDAWYRMGCLPSPVSA